MENNIILSSLIDTDGYKYGMYKQYPPNVTGMLSYLESRGGKHDATLFFGLQYYLKKFLVNRITMEQVDEAKEFAEKYGVSFNYDGWVRIATVLEGKIPLRIKAVPEGAVIPVSNILMSVESTDPETFWVVSWFECLLLRLWYPITVATNSYFTKKLIKKYLDETSDNPDDEIDFKLHDFGSRGVSSQESAMIGGAAHLVSFKGSDTAAGVYMANKYYHSEMSGFSISASEHSTMTMWGKENETKAYENMLDINKDSAIFACVSDSYDIYNATENIWGGELKQRIIDYKGTTIIRPDSGPPVTIILELLALLDKTFGSTTNSKGFAVINHDVRLIQGDGIGHDTIELILQKMKECGWSATNVGFGMGGGLLQNLNRDTQRFAFKCSWAMIDGVGIDVYKDPVTDTGKRSKRGRLQLDVIQSKGQTFAHTCREGEAVNPSLLTVYEDGEILTEYTFENIRDLSCSEPMVSVG